MANSKLYRENVTLLIALPEAVKDWGAPTAAELNKQFDYTAGTGLGEVTFSPYALVHNLTCALSETDTTFEKTSHETDDSLSFCDDAGRTELTTSNQTITYSFFRDADRAAASLYNEALEFMMKPDMEYYFIRRIGGKSNDPFVIGDEISIARRKTDNLVDVNDLGSKVRATQTTLADGYDLWNYTLAA